MKRLKKQALKKLEESYVPDELPCRDKEKNKILKYIEQGIENDGNTNSLYISGLPGLGKTACVHEIVRKCTDEYSDKSIKFLQLNCLKLKSPSEFYSYLFKLMTGLSKKVEEAKRCLNGYFTFGEWDSHFKKGKNKKYVTRNDIVILLVDEIDYLITKDQDILYNLFNWTHEEKSQMMIICIANTLDFPKKLIKKIDSRMGRQRLIFSPYNSESLQKIIENRLKDTEVFSKDAVLYVSKKIAAYSSDVRKSLHICRLAIELSLKRKEYDQIIEIAIINCAFESYYSNVLFYLIQSKSLPMKLILAAMIVCFKKTPSKAVSVYLLYEKYLKFVDITGIHKFNYQHFFGMLKKFDGYGIIDLKLTSGIHYEVSFLISTDSAEFTLKDEKKITSRIHFGGHN